jgi:hypothetical protein
MIHAGVLIRAQTILYQHVASPTLKEAHSLHDEVWMDTKRSYTQVVLESLAQAVLELSK